MSRRGRLLVAMVCSTLAVHGQVPAGFEVVSIRPTGNGADVRALVQAVPGRLLMQGFALRTFVVFAFGVADYQVSGGPSWIAGDRYDIQAKAQDSGATVKQMEGPMLQALLRDRFSLSVHREMKELPVFELTAGNGGAKLQPSGKENCVPYSMDSAPPAAPGRGEARPVFCGFPHLSSDGLKRTLDGASITLESLAGSLARAQLHMPVIDKTGLTGTYDIHLEWFADSEPGVSDGPTIFTALKEQLGLKLESAKGPVEVIVIDHVEKPSAN